MVDKNKIDFTITRDGMNLISPLMTASGTFGYGDEYRGIIDYSLIGGVVTKSLSLLPRPGNPPPRICETSCGGAINSIGLANPGVDEFMDKKLAILPIEDTKVYLSMVGETVEEFVCLTEKLEVVDSISGYELNLSCPNVRRGGLDLGADSQAVSAIVKAVRETTDRFFSVKLTPNQPDIGRLAESAALAGANALTLVNTLIGMSIDTEKRKPRLGSITGGYSGPPIKPVALANVYKAAQVVDIPIWASGGIVSGKDGIDFLLAGATTLQLGTVLFVDPQAPERILAEMTEYCHRHSINSISELIGGLDTHIG